MNFISIFQGISPRGILRLLASPGILFWLVPYMMLLLVFGTVAQKYMGLYGALDVYFYSWIIWSGPGFFPLPLAGGLSAAALFFINLLARYLGYSVWSLNRTGLHLAHLGAILLLIGGAFSGLTRIDTVIPLSPGETASYTQSYDEAVFNIYKNGEIFKSLPLEKERNIDGLPFDLDIIKVCHNCLIKADTQGMKLVGTQLDKNPEQNMPGLDFTITYPDDQKTDTYMTFLFFPKPPEVTVGQDRYLFAVERQRYALPFALTLDDFSIDYYPGTLTARSYMSDVTVTDGDVVLKARIAMNEPLSYKGYRFYQSAYLADNAGNYSSVIAVSSNSGRIFPYLAGLVMAAGLLLHVVLKLKGRITPAHIKFTSLLFFSLAFLPPAHAAVKVTQDFATLPVLHEGRIKPIESFARHHIKMFSGKENPKDMDASYLLATLMFDPQAAIALPLFDIKNPDVLHLIGLPSLRKRLYSYAEIAEGLEKTKTLFAAAAADEQQEKTITPVQRDLIGLHSKGLYFLQLVRSFSYAMPLDGDDEKLFPDYRSLEKNAGFLKEALNAIRTKKGDDFNSYTTDEKLTATLNYRLDLMRTVGFQNVLFRVVPSSDAAEKFAAPWQILTGGKGLPGSDEYLELWASLMMAWQTGHQQLWDSSVQALQTLYAGQVSRNKILLEYAYIKINPFLWAGLLCFMAAAFFVLSHLHRKKTLCRTAQYFGFLSSGALVAGIAARMFLLDRPPVGTLYESIFFVCMVLSIALAVISLQRREDMLPAAGFTLTGLLVVFADTLGHSSGDLTPLEAVLNTNFWLATHVLIITAGYAWCLLTSVLAHIQLYKTGRDIDIQKTRHAEGENILHSHALIALFLVSTGTILGGIWADMSWGRFWGWDPKENGALLIAMWLVWALHGRASRHLSALFYTVIMAATSIIVMLSWFGVNLLNVGLHSYGFISGIAESLAGFVLFEILLLAFLYMKARQNKDA